MTKATKRSEIGVITDAHIDSEFDRIRQELGSLQIENETMREAMTDAILALDNIGWVPMGGDYSERGVSLRPLKDWTELNQQLLAVNPLFKRGTNIRVSYIFGEDLEYRGAETPRAKKFIEDNADRVFSQQGLTELEGAFNTDGNVFLVLNKGRRKIQRIPLREITNVATRPGDAEDVMYIQRSWTEVVTDVSTSEESTKTRPIKMWYPLIDLPDNDRRTSIGGVPVSQDSVMIHAAVNKQVGWIWGVPDYQPAVFWGKAYKEFMEANYTLARALARFTWKITNSTASQQKRASSKLVAATPAIPGYGNGSGSAVNTEVGQDIQAINKAGANVDFEAGAPLAAMVASALEVSLAQLLSDSSKGTTGSTDVLDIPQLKAMKSRQKLFRRMFERIFAYFGLKGVEVIFPPIQWEAMHRVIQAIVLAASTNAIFPEETRGMMIKAFNQYGIDAKPGLPEDGRNAKFVSGVDAQEEADAQRALDEKTIDTQADAAAAKAKQANTNPGTSPQKTPKGSSGRKGRSASGALADGDHSQRKSQGK